MKYEYCWATTNPFNNEMNKLGAEGWRVVPGIVCPWLGDGDAWPRVLMEREVSS